MKPTALPDWKWKLFLPAALACGILLRTLHVENMEWKEDEQYHYIQSQLIGVSAPWPWLGIPSGVYLANPGMSVWVFAALARLARADNPLELARALQLFAVFGMALAVPFALKFVRDVAERTLWFWSFALAMVNPILVLYHRKLWPQGFLPFFSMLVYAGWWKRGTFWGAALWGFAGAVVGQVHMSGFFFSAALFGWTISFRRHEALSYRGWLAGSVLGAWPLIPWLHAILTRPVGGRVSSGWGEAMQLKYWNFWFSDPLGLHVGNALGIHRGSSHFAQLSDFIRYPVIGGQATYLVGAAHLVLLIIGLVILVRGISSLFAKRGDLGAALIGRGSDTAFLQSSALFGCGALLTLTGVMIRRYYMCVTYPLELIWLTRAAGLLKRPTWVLAAIWIAQLVISAGMVHYVDVNEGSTQGDYGDAYHAIIGRDANSPAAGDPANASSP